MSFLTMSKWKFVSISAVTGMIMLIVFSMFFKGYYAIPMSTKLIQTSLYGLTSAVTGYLQYSIESKYYSNRDNLKMSEKLIITGFLVKVGVPQLVINLFSLYVMYILVQSYLTWSPSTVIWVFIGCTFFATLNFILRAIQTMRNARIYNDYYAF